MMSDRTNEQNLGQRGNPEARINESNVGTPFDDKPQIIAPIQSPVTANDLSEFQQTTARVLMRAVASS